MPNYKYQCGDCEYADNLNLALSFNPAIQLSCPRCEEGMMARKIILFNSFSMPKQRLGEWFKKHTGEEFGE